MSPLKLPKKIKEALKGEEQYKGWENATASLDHNTGIYWIHLRNGKSIRRYGFDEDGNVVSVREHDYVKPE